jgi:hypothetical protein
VNPRPPSNVVHCDGSTVGETDFTGVGLGDAVDSPVEVGKIIVTGAAVILANAGRPPANGSTLTPPVSASDTFEVAAHT